MNIVDLTEDKLAKILHECDDGLSDHVPWIDKDGEVYISSIGAGLGPKNWEESVSDKLAVRLESLQCGNDYVGPAAANDKIWVKKLLNGLITAWEQRGSFKYFDWY